MPRNQRPSFLKRQKEQQRKAKAEEKREARRARKLGSLVNEELGSDAEGDVDAEVTTEKEEGVPEA